MAVKWFSLRWLTSGSLLACKPNWYLVSWSRRLGIRRVCWWLRNRSKWAS